MSAPAYGLYLFHFDPRYEHAGHYLGYADDIPRRLAQHFAAGSRASPLVRAALAAGCAVTLARTWPAGDRNLERRLKRSGGLKRHCPICQERGDTR